MLAHELVHWFGAAHRLARDLTGRFGSHTEQPEIKKLLAAVIAGDTVINSAIDRLSRDTADLLTIALDLKAVGVALNSLAEPIFDTTSELAAVVLAVLGLAATLEHKRYRERTVAVRAQAEADGVKFGPKPKLTHHQQRESISWRDVDGESPANIDRAST